MMAEVPTLDGTQVRQYDDAKLFLWVALKRGRESIHTASVVVEQPSESVRDYDSVTIILIAISRCLGINGEHLLE